MDYSYQDQWISLVCLAEVFNLVCMGFLPQFIVFILVLCIELVLDPLFISEFICFPTNMCISGALKLSLQTMPPYPVQLAGQWWRDLSFDVPWTGIMQGDIDGCSVETAAVLSSSRIIRALLNISGQYTHN